MQSWLLKFFSFLPCYIFLLLSHIYDFACNLKLILGYKNQSCINTFHINININLHVYIYIIDNLPKKKKRSKIWTFSVLCIFVVQHLSSNSYALANFPKPIIAPISLSPQQIFCPTPCATLYPTFYYIVISPS